MAFATIDLTKGITGVLPSANATYSTSRPNAQPLIINGDMAVAQRDTSVTGITGNGVTTLDRMYNAISGIGTYTVAQEAQTSGNAFVNGFANAYRLDCTTADASPAAADYLYLQYNFEGQDVQVFKKGTANAQKYTLAFWVKSNKTGTGNIQLKDKDNSNRQCTQSYTISSANTWEHKICVFGADTTGAMDDDNAKSLQINWWLGSGTNYSSGTANHGTWEAQDNTKVNDGGTLNINDNTANDWSITGIQLEVGEYTSSTLPPFQHESFGENLARCQRYYYFHVSEAVNNDYDTTICLTSHYNNSSMKGYVSLPTRMRVTPTLNQNTGSNMYRVYEANSNATMTSLNITNESTFNTAVLNHGSSISVTQGSCGNLQTMDGTAFVAFDAEL